MSQTATRLPKRFPVRSKYAVESCGPFVRRYVEFPDGRKVPLPKRKALPCNRCEHPASLRAIPETTEGTTRRGKTGFRLLNRVSTSRRRGVLLHRTKAENAALRWNTTCLLFSTPEFTSNNTFRGAVSVHNS
jgi:hypothetical protein